MNSFSRTSWIAVFMLVLLAVSGCDKVASPTPPPSTVSMTAPSVDSSSQQQLSQAVIELNQRNYGNAIKITLRVSQADPHNTEAYVIEAEARSESGDPMAALDALEKAIGFGFNDVSRLMREQRLDAVRSLPEFPEMLRRHGLMTPTMRTQVSAGDVSIKDDGNTQVIQAGDVTLRVPKN